MCENLLGTDCSGLGGLTWRFGNAEPPVRTEVGEVGIKRVVLGEHLGGAITMRGVRGELDAGLMVVIKKEKADCAAGARR